MAGLHRQLYMSAFELNCYNPGHLLWQSIVLDE
jgi:hypothetical protein